MALRGKPEKLDAAKLWDYALRVLGQRAYSSAELRRKLAGRAVTPAAVSETMAKLAEYGYLDDGKFAASFATARLENQGFGRMRVLRELRTKQVSQAIAETAVTAAFSGVEEDALVAQFLERKYRGKDMREYLSEEAHLASAFRRLRTAGFGAGASIRVLKQFASRAAELEDMEVDGPENETI